MAWWLRTLRDSLYLLEGFLNQSSSLEPTQIMTDTADYQALKGVSQNRINLRLI